VIRLALRVRRADAEIVLAELTDLAPSGVEETDLGDTIEYAVYGAEGELPALPAVRALVGDALVEVVTTEVADDWADRWRAFHEPILIKDRLYVRPPWSPAYDGAGEVSDLIVDPGQAFGTGAHATTRLCLEFLVELTDARVAAGEPLGPVLDLGCGSGVLGIAASRLGWGPVHGVDHEVASVEATLENSRVNAEPMTAARFDLLRDGATAMPGAGSEAGDGARDAGPEATETAGAGTTETASAGTSGRPGRAPLVLANLLRPLLLRVAADGFRGEPPHHLIASGLLAHEQDGIAAAFARIGLVEAERRTQGDWAALLLRRG
jgi:ribosomal protein L11 methyltransferase